MPIEPDGISGVHRAVIGREQRVTIPPPPIPSAATLPPNGAMREARICPHLQAA